MGKELPPTLKANGDGSYDAEELIAKTAQKISEQVAAHSELAGRTFIFGGWVEDGSCELAVYSPEDLCSTLMWGSGS